MRQTMVKTTQINNRRYLGNKYRLLKFIKSAIESECSELKIVADIFAGTGAVGSAFQDRQLITNDIMYSNYVSNYAWFAPESYNSEKLRTIIDAYNRLNMIQENYMTTNFSNTYFSFEDCSKIGFIREDIERLRREGALNNRECAILITSLLYAMDKIAKTCGHYDAYRKGAEFNNHLELLLPLASNNNNKNNACYNLDANKLAKSIFADLVYLDPPYNSRQYCDAYHLLENVARWKKPEVFGVARKMNRDALKSRYCTREATEAFSDLINSINSRYIVLSYNNMAKKGNDRSNARIADDDILDILSSKGNVKVYSEKYKAFSTGKSHISDNEERLFICFCKGV